MNELFNAKFSEALKTVGKQIDFVKLFENRQEFRDRIIEVIGNDLNGYVLEDVAIDYLAESRWPGHVDVGCRISRVGGKSFTVATGVFKDGRLIATAQSVIAYRRGGGTAVIDGALRERLQALHDQAGHDGRDVAG